MVHSLSTRCPRLFSRLAIRPEIGAISEHFLSLLFAACSWYCAMKKPDATFARCITSSGTFVVIPSYPCPIRRSARSTFAFSSSFCALSTSSCASEASVVAMTCPRATCAPFCTSTRPTLAALSKARSHLAAAFSLPLHTSWRWNVWLCSVVTSTYISVDIVSAFCMSGAFGSVAFFPQEVARSVAVMISV